MLGSLHRIDAAICFRMFFLVLFNIILMVLKDCFRLLSGETQTLVSANFCCCLRPDLLLSRMFSYKAQQVVKLRITSYCSSSHCFIFSLENQRGNKSINSLPDFLAVVYGQATCY